MPHPLETLQSHELWAENVAWRERAMSRYTYLPAFEGATAPYEHELFHLEDSHLQVFTSSLTGAFAIANATDSVIDTVTTEYGCSGWGFIAEDTNITSIRSHYDGVAVPYLLNSTGPTENVEFFGDVRRDLTSVCDWFDATLPIPGIADDNMLLVGAHFNRGEPMYPETFAERAELLLSTDNMVPVPHNIKILLGSYGPLPVGGACGGSIILAEPVTLPPPPGPSPLALTPPYPLYNLLDGGGGQRFIGSTTVPVVGVANVPLVSPDLSAVHYLVMVPGTAAPSVLGFYNWIFDSPSTALPDFGPFVPGTTSGGFGFRTWLIDEIMYFYQEDSFPDACTSCGLGVPTGPGSLFATSLAVNNMYTGCLQGYVVPTDFNLRIERAVSDCGDNGEGTKGASHSLDLAGPTMQLVMDDRAARRTEAVSQSPLLAEETLVQIEFTQDAAGLDFLFSGGGLVSLELEFSAQEIQAAIHNFNIEANAASLQSIFYDRFPSFDSGGAPTDFHQSPTIDKATLNLGRLFGLPDDVLLSVEPLNGPLNIEQGGNEVQTLTNVKLDQAAPVRLTLESDVDDLDVHVTLNANLTPEDDSIVMRITHEHGPGTVALDMTSGIARDATLIASKPGSLFTHVHVELIDSVSLTPPAATPDFQVQLKTPLNEDIYDAGAIFANVYVLTESIFADFKLFDVDGYKEFSGGLKDGKYRIEGFSIDDERYIMNAEYLKFDGSFDLTSNVIIHSEATGPAEWNITYKPEEFEDGLSAYSNFGYFEEIDFNIMTDVFTANANGDFIDYIDAWIADEGGWDAVLTLKVGSPKDGGATSMFFQQGDEWNIDGSWDDGGAASQLEVNVYTQPKTHVAGSLISQESPYIVGEVTYNDLENGGYTKVQPFKLLNPSGLGVDGRFDGFFGPDSSTVTVTAFAGAFEKLDVESFVPGIGSAGDTTFFKVGPARTLTIQESNNDKHIVWNTPDDSSFFSFNPYLHVKSVPSVGAAVKTIDFTVQDLARPFGLWVTQHADQDDDADAEEACRTKGPTTLNLISDGTGSGRADIDVDLFSNGITYVADNILVKELSIKEEEYLGCNILSVKTDATLNYYKEVQLFKSGGTSQINVSVPSISEGFTTAYTAGLDLKVSFGEVTIQASGMNVLELIANRDSGRVFVERINLDYLGSFVLDSEDELTLLEDFELTIIKDTFGDLCFLETIGWQDECVQLGSCSAWDGYGVDIEWPGENYGFTMSEPDFHWASLYVIPPDPFGPDPKVEIARVEVTTEFHPHAGSIPTCP